jgi:hypothetical protein
MAFPSRPTQYTDATAGFRSMSDEDFARLSTEEKLRHVHLGMRELTQALVELAAATKRRGRQYGE